MAEIKFYHHGNAYYEFTNFNDRYPFNVNLICDNGEVINGPWKTSEYLFQAAKFVKHPNLVRQIKNCANSREVFVLANGRNGKLKNQSLPDLVWRTRSVDVMRWVVYWKFKQSSYLTTILLGTGNDKLIEDTESDTRNPGEPWKKDQFWGNATKYDWTTKRCLGVEGDNMLGKILEETREILRNEANGISVVIPQQPFAASTGVWTPPTPPSTPPPSSTFTATFPSDDEKLTPSELHEFEAKIKTELNNRGIEGSDLSSKYKNWQNYIRNKKWSKGELNEYENELKDEIERVANEKKKSISSPEANQNYRDKWVQDLEKQFQELEFGDYHDTAVRELLEIQEKIKGTEFGTEEEVENRGIGFLNFLKKFGKNKSGQNPINNPNSPSPSTPENENPTELTPEEQEALLNEWKDLKEKSPEDLKEEDNKPVETNTIKKYFEDNDIYSITLEVNGDLTIQFQDKSTQTTIANNKQLQLVKKYFRQNKKKSVNIETLNTSQNSNSDKTNYLTRVLVGGGLVILVLFSAFVVLRKRKLNKKKQVKA